ncbi:MAG: M56 family metallopeptidase [Candidatus Pelethousia sp.]|nr:M56 family metallopeptidase [Candidatus Pelethousia sp.]
MKTIVDALLETSLYAAVVAGAILLFRLLFRKSISPRLQYLAWLLLILRLLLPVTIESGFHVESLFPQPAIEAPSAQAAAPAIQAQAPANAAQTPISPASRAEAPAETPSKTDWYAVALRVWLCGMGIFALWMGAVKLRFYRRMRARRLDTPAETEALYATCKEELGIERPMPLWAVDAAISPGIVCFAEPVLLLPESLLASPEALRFALLHELTHQKRGDHLLCGLMNLLRMVYWFHPVVHYAFSEMQADMETACDADVLRHLEAGEKRGYLATVVSLFSFEAQPQLGMARSRTRHMAERRMKGAFMKSTTSLASKLAASGLALVLLLACFTTACQKAPVGGTATLERKNEATPTPRQSAALPGETPDIPAQTAGAQSAGEAPPTPDSRSAGVLPTPTPASIPPGAQPTPVPTALDPASEVKMIQERLVALGYAVQVTGDYDEATAAAVCAFQTRNGLQADGYVGLKTQERLYAADAVGAGAGAYAVADAS